MIDGSVAQWLEQGTHKPKVAGSNPARANVKVNVERWLSGRKRQIANLLYKFFVPRVRIPLSPIFKHKPKLSCMKNWQLKNIDKSIFEKTGLIPRSIIKIADNFKNQLDPTREQNVIEQIRVSRYQTISSIKYLSSLLLVPLILNTILKLFVFGPFVQYWWQKQNINIFLNDSQQIRAFEELQLYEEQLRFEILIGKKTDLSIKNINLKIKNKANEIATQYNEESKNSIINILSDTLSLATFFALVLNNQKQFSILFAIKAFPFYKFLLRRPSFCSLQQIFATVETNTEYLEFRTATVFDLFNHRA